MRSWTKNTAFVFVIVIMLACLYPSAPLRAEEEALPEVVSTRADVPFAKVGHGTYRKLGFRIYDATLWAPQRSWEASKPYALQLCYTRSFSKKTLVDAVMDDISDQGVADEETRARWKGVLDASLSDIEDGDVLIGLALPGQKTLLFRNGVTIASIEEPAFSDAFFGIWLGEHADEDLRKELLGGV